MSAKKKVTLYFAEETINEIKQEALRHDRSLSWILEMSWRIARSKVQAMPGVAELSEVDWEGAAE